MGSEKKINWWRVLANGGVSFFTGLAAAIGAGLPSDEMVKVAILVSFCQSGLAFFLELRREAEGAPSMMVLL
jgi:hypothetical protein